MSTIKTYSELIKIPTFEERYEYLKLYGHVGYETFGSRRYINQKFYSSKEWRNFRNYIITRDSNGSDWCCDLAMNGHEIYGDKILIHHINPITIEDIYDGNISILMDPENVICTMYNTHQAIHYGDVNLLRRDPIQRFKNDTCPWK